MSSSRHHRHRRQGAARVDLARRALRDRAQRRGHAPGRHRPARGRRSGTHSTKTRAEVKGGGAKPWRQKGTGRAASRLDPLAALAGRRRRPRPQAPRLPQRTPKKMVRLALCSALSDRAADGKVMVVDDWGIDEPKHASGPPRSSRRSACGRRASATTASLLVLERGEDADLEVVPQPRRPGADRAARGAQRLRRARQRLARLQRARRSNRRRRSSARPRVRTRRRRRERAQPPRHHRSGPSCRRSRTPRTTTTSTRSSSPTTPTRSRSRRRSSRSSASRSQRVNTLNRQGKRKRNRRTGDWGQRSDQKRAIVSLAEGDRIEIFGS